MSDTDFSKKTCKEIRRDTGIGSYIELQYHCQNELNASAMQSVLFDSDYDLKRASPKAISHLKDIGVKVYVNKGGKPVEV